MDERLKLREGGTDGGGHFLKPFPQSFPQIPLISRSRILPERVSNGSPPYNTATRELHAARRKAAWRRFQTNLRVQVYISSKNAPQPILGWKNCIPCSPAGTFDPQLWFCCRSCSDSRDYRGSGKVGPGLSDGSCRSERPGSLRPFRIRHLEPDTA